MESGGGTPLVPVMGYEDDDIMGYGTGWFDLAYGQRLPLSINSSEVLGSHTNFPLLISSTIPELIGQSPNEINITDQMNMPLDFEIQKLNTLTGELIAHVRMSTINGGEAIYIYHDNPTAIDAQNPTAVWNSNYVAVYHGETDGKDSTINANDLTNTAAIASGKIGNAFSYSGAETSLANPFANFPTTALTIEFWLKTSQSTPTLFNYASNGGTPVLDDFTVKNPVLMNVLIANDLFQGLIFNQNIFRHITVTWESVDGSSRIIRDGSTISGGNVALGLSIGSNGSLVLGAAQTAVGGPFNEFFTGILDEIRISNIERNFSYTVTGYRNQNNPETFYTKGANQIQPPMFAMGYET